MLTLDLARLDGSLAVDPVSLTATVQAGMTGPALEEALGEHGLTLGHFPQSFEFSTVGGWVATRSSGQASTGYGRIDALVVGLRAVTPSGEIATRSLPASAAGPSLRELLVGSEGTLGVIVEVDAAGAPAPGGAPLRGVRRCRLRGRRRAFRELVQAGAAPDVARLSDESETRVSLALPAATASRRSRSAATCGRAARRRLPRDRRLGGTVERTAPPPDARRGCCANTAGSRWGQVGPPGSTAATTRPTCATSCSRTACSSRRSRPRRPGTSSAAAPRRRDALDGALRGRGTPPVVWCARLAPLPCGRVAYFTFVARQQAGAELEQWHAAKAAANDAILASGGTITHHHAVGRDHAPGWPGGRPARGRAAARREGELDPAGMMNPGKLLDPAPLPGAPPAP